MIHFENTVTLGNIIMGVPLILSAIWGFAVVHTKVGHIEDKLDEFITKNEVGALKQGADQEHAALRREINGLRQEMHQPGA